MSVQSPRSVHSEAMSSDQGPLLIADSSLIARIYTVVRNILSRVVEYVVPYGHSIEDTRAYAAGVLMNSNGPQIGNGLQIGDDRYVFAVRREDDDAYTHILTHSRELPFQLGSYIQREPLFEFSTPNMCDTDASLSPEIPHASLINWFLSKRNIRQLLQAAPGNQQLALTIFLKQQFLKDFIRSGAAGDKTYVINGVKIDNLSLIGSLEKLNTDEEKADFLIAHLFSEPFLQEHSDKVLPLLALICQNAGITAHAMIEAHEKELNKDLDLICLDLSRQQDSFKVTTENDRSVTFSYTFKAPYKFIDKEGNVRWKDATLIFKANLKTAEDGLSSPPKILYSYLVRDFNSTSS